MPELVCAADDPRWLAERRAGVTATDITAITGLSPYESEYSLYWKKLGHIPDTHEDNDRLRLGRDLEPLIASRWREATGKPVLPGLTTSPGLFRSTACPWQMATIDRFTDDREPLEMKSWADADKSAWGPGIIYDDDGTTLVYDDQVPPRIRAQVLWQMDTLDVATGHVGVLFLPSGEFRSYVISHNPMCMWRDYPDGGGLAEGKCDVCTDLRLLRAAGEEFMARIRHELPPPSPDASTATLAALKARFADPRKDKQAEIDPATYELWWRHKAEAERHADLAKGHESVIREQAGDAGILTVAGIPVARHTVSVVKAHQRKESRRDSITRIKGGDTSE